MYDIGSQVGSLYIIIHYSLGSGAFPPCEMSKIAGNSTRVECEFASVCLPRSMMQYRGSSNVVAE